MLSEYERAAVFQYADFNTTTLCRLVSKLRRNKRIGYKIVWRWGCHQICALGASIRKLTTALQKMRLAGLYVFSHLASYSYMLRLPVTYPLERMSQLRRVRDLGSSIFHTSWEKASRLLLCVAVWFLLKKVD